MSAGFPPLPEDAASIRSAHSRRSSSIATVDSLQVKARKALQSGDYALARKLFRRCLKVHLETLPANEKLVNEGTLADGSVVSASWSAGDQPSPLAAGEAEGREIEADIYAHLAEATELMGSVLESVDIYIRAVAAYEKLFELALDPQMAAEFGPDKARHFQTRLREVCSNLGFVHVELAKQYKKATPQYQSHHQAAERYFQRNIELFPGDNALEVDDAKVKCNALTNLASVQTNLQSYRAARRTFLRCMEIEKYYGFSTKHTKSSLGIVDKRIETKNQLMLMKAATKFKVMYKRRVEGNVSREEAARRYDVEVAEQAAFEDIGAQESVDMEHRDTDVRIVRLLKREEIVRSDISFQYMQQESGLWIESLVELSRLAEIRVITHDEAKSRSNFHRMLLKGIELITLDEQEAAGRKKIEKEQADDHRALRTQSAELQAEIESQQLLTAETAEVVRMETVLREAVETEEDQERESVSATILHDIDELRKFEAHIELMVALMEVEEQARSHVVDMEKEERQTGVVNAKEEDELRLEHVSAAGSTSGEEPPKEPQAEEVNESEHNQDDVGDDNDESGANSEHEGKPVVPEEAPQDEIASNADAECVDAGSSSHEQGSEKATDRSMQPTEETTNQESKAVEPSDGPNEGDNGTNGEQKDDPPEQKETEPEAQNTEVEGSNNTIADEAAITEVVEDEVDERELIDANETTSREELMDDISSIIAELEASKQSAAARIEELEGQLHELFEQAEPKGRATLSDHEHQEWQSLVEEADTEHDALRAFEVTAARDAAVAKFCGREERVRTEIISSEATDWDQLIGRQVSGGKRIQQQAVLQQREAECGVVAQEEAADRDGIAEEEASAMEVNVGQMYESWKHVTSIEHEHAIDAFFKGETAERHEEETSEADDREVLELTETEERAALGDELHRKAVAHVMDVVGSEEAADRKETLKNETQERSATHKEYSEALEEIKAAERKARDERRAVVAAEVSKRTQLTRAEEDARTKVKTQMVKEHAAQISKLEAAHAALRKATTAARSLPFDESIGRDEVSAEEATAFMRFGAAFRAALERKIRKAHMAGIQQKQTQRRRDEIYRRKLEGIEAKEHAARFKVAMAQEQDVESILRTLVKGITTTNEADRLAGAQRTKFFCKTQHLILRKEADVRRETEHAQRREFLLIGTECNEKRAKLTELTRTEATREYQSLLKESVIGRSEKQQRSDAHKDRLTAYRGHADSPVHSPTNATSKLATHGALSLHTSEYVQRAMLVLDRLEEEKRGDIEQEQDKSWVGLSYTELWKYDRMAEKAATRTELGRQKIQKAAAKVVRKAVNEEDQDRKELVGKEAAARSRMSRRFLDETARLIKELDSERLHDKTHHLKLESRKMKVIAEQRRVLRQERYAAAGADAYAAEAAPPVPSSSELSLPPIGAQYLSKEDKRAIAHRQKREKRAGVRIEMRLMHSVEYQARGDLEKAERLDFHGIILSHTSLIKSMAVVARQNRDATSTTKIPKPPRSTTEDNRTSDRSKTRGAALRKHDTESESKVFSSMQRIEQRQRKALQSEEAIAFHGLVETARRVGKTNGKPRGPEPAPPSGAHGSLHYLKPMKRRDYRAAGRGSVSRPPPGTGGGNSEVAGSVALQKDTVENDESDRMKNEPSDVPQTVETIEEGKSSEGSGPVAEQEQPAEHESDSGAHPSDAEQAEEEPSPNGEKEGSAGVESTDADRETEQKQQQAETGGHLSATPHTDGGLQGEDSRASSAALQQDSTAFVTSGDTFTAEPSATVESEPSVATRQESTAAVAVESTVVVKEDTLATEPSAAVESSASFAEPSLSKEPTSQQQKEEENEKEEPASGTEPEESKNPEPTKEESQPLLAQSSSYDSDDFDLVEDDSDDNQPAQ